MQLELIASDGHYCKFDDNQFAIDGHQILVHKILVLILDFINLCYVISNSCLLFWVVLFDLWVYIANLWMCIDYPQGTSSTRKALQVLGVFRSWIHEWDFVCPPACESKLSNIHSKSIVWSDCATQSAHHLRILFPLFTINTAIQTLFRV